MSSAVSTTSGGRDGRLVRCEAGRCEQAASRMAIGRAARNAVVMSSPLKECAGLRIYLTLHDFGVTHAKALDVDHAGRGPAGAAVRTDPCQLARPPQRGAGRGPRGQALLPRAARRATPADAVA